MEKRISIDCARSNPAERCINGWFHLRTGMKIIIAIGVLAIIALVVLMALYFRKSLFILAIPSMVTLFSAGAVFRHDHRFVWPLIGISFFHLFLTLYLTLIFLFYFFFKPLYIIMIFNWAFDTLHGSKNAQYYVKCAIIMLVLVSFFIYNLWQLQVSFKFYLHVQLLNELELPVKKCQGEISGSSGSSVALNFSHRDSPSPPLSKRSVGGTSAIIFVNGIDGQNQTGDQQNVNVLRHTSSINNNGHLARENHRFM